ncbi:MAG: hypothetical protein ACLQU5_16300 [Isosphaeraceae bacterium]
MAAVLLALCRLVVFSQFGDGFTDIVEATTQLWAQDSFLLPVQGIAVVAGELLRHPTQQLGRALEFSPKQAQVRSELVRKSQELSLPAQGFVAETLRDNVVNYVCRDRAKGFWQYGYEKQARVSPTPNGGARACAR